MRRSARQIRARAISDDRQPPIARNGDGRGDRREINPNHGLALPGHDATLHDHGWVTLTYPSLVARNLIVASKLPLNENWPAASAVVDSPACKPSTTTTLAPASGLKPVSSTNPEIDTTPFQVTVAVASVRGPSEAETWFTGHRQRARYGSRATRWPGQHLSPVDATPVSVSRFPGAAVWPDGMRCRCSRAELPAPPGRAAW